MTGAHGLIIFDCDGTLVDSLSTICLAMEEAFATHRLEPPSRASVRHIVGLSLPEAIARLLPEEEGAFHLLLAEDYKRAFHGFRGRGLVEEPLYPGVVDLIARLDAAGWRLGVATGKSDRGLRLCLDRHGIAHHFVTLQTADHHPSKPHPAMVEAAMAEAGADPQESWVVGDTIYDMAMGQAAGARPVGVSWGYHDPVDLNGAGAAAIIDTPSGLLSLLEVG